MELNDAIKKRASVREYLDKPVPGDLLEQLVDAGRMAPSARAVEPWEFIIITKKDVLRKISSFAPNGKFIKDASAAIVIISEDTKYYLEDGCAATENILLKAADLKLGACWIAGDKKDYCSEMLSMLGAPEGMKLVSIISIGWGKKEPAQNKHRLLKDVMHWEKF